jgi:hypothetical protein
MTKEEITEMATKVYGECDWHESALHHLEAFAKLVAEKEYERGFIDGMQKQMQSSVDKAVNAMSKREWVGLKGEPVAWMTENKYLITKDENLAKKIKEKGDELIFPLYTTPQRTWVGLTSEDMKDERTHNFDFIHGARWAEEKIKEKNT